MSNPNERLRKAADLLDQRAGGATEGPWTVTRWEDFSGRQATWTLEGVERFRDLKNDMNLGEDEGTARYIATVHPGFGKLAAAAMREAAHTIEGNARLVAQGRPTINIASAFLLDLADLVLRGE